MFIVLINDCNGVLENIIHIGVDRRNAEQKFLEACKASDPELDEDIHAVLDDGFFLDDNGGCVMLIDTDGFTSDDKIAAMIDRHPDRDTNKIVKWARCGEIGPVDTIDEVMEQSDLCLDAANSWDVCGEVLFQAEDGHWYIGATQFTISRAHPEYVDMVLNENNG